MRMVPTFFAMSTPCRRSIIWDREACNSLKQIEMQIRNLRNFPLPAVVCSKELDFCQGNTAAQIAFPALCTAEGLRATLSEFDLQALLQQAEQEGCSTVAEVLPLSGISLSIMPIREGDRLRGATFFFLNAQALPETHTPYNISRTAESLSNGIRGGLADIFSVMDSASVKADLLQCGWIKPGINRITAGSYGILRIAENISTYAQLQSGAISPQRASLDLAAFLHERKHVLSEIAGQMGISFHLRLPLQPCLVNADRSLLELALFNLIHNSLYFTRDGNTVTLSLQQETDAVLVSVQDQGIGISPDFLPRIWTPYAVCDNDRQGAGLGLGLPIVKLVAQLHEGSCELSSRAGEGTTALLRLPMPSFSSSVALAQGDDADDLHNRFSRLYVGLTDAQLSPYRSDKSSL